MPRLTGKRVLLIGAETELGGALAPALSEASATLALVSTRSDADAAFAVQRLARKVGAATSQAIDGTNETAAKVMVRQVSKALGGLNAAVLVSSPEFRPPPGVRDPEQIVRLMEQQGRGHAAMLKAIERELDKEGGPIVIADGMLFYGWSDDEDPPRYWFKPVRVDGRTESRVTRDIMRAVASKRPWWYDHPKLGRFASVLLRFIMRPYWWFRGLLDYQYRDR